MNSIKITLDQTLKQGDSDLLTRYLNEEYRFSLSEWQRMRRIIAELARSQVIFQGKRLTFKQFYQQMIDGPYAHPFLQQLYQLTDVMSQGQRLRTATARKIVRWLRDAGFANRQTDYAGYLVAYCLYWWSAFARGYIFELFVFRQLQVSGAWFTTSKRLVDKCFRMTNCASRTGLRISGEGEGFENSQIREIWRVNVHLQTFCSAL